MLLNGFSYLSKMPNNEVKIMLQLLCVLVLVAKPSSYKESPYIGCKFFGSIRAFDLLYIHLLKLCRTSGHYIVPFAILNICWTVF